MPGVDGQKGDRHYFRGDFEYAGVDGLAIVAALGPLVSAITIGVDTQVGEASGLPDARMLQAALEGRTWRRRCVARWPRTRARRGESSRSGQTRFTDANAKRAPTAARKRLLE